MQEVECCRNWNREWAGCEPHEPATRPTLTGLGGGTVCREVAGVLLSRLLLAARAQLAARVLPTLAGVVPMKPKLG